MNEDLERSVEKQARRPSWSPETVFLSDVQPHGRVVHAIVAHLPRPRTFESTTVMPEYM